MATEVASLFATIGAKNEGFKKGAGEVKGGLKDLEKGFFSWMHGVEAAAGGVGIAIAGLKKIMDFGREGAELVRTEDKFNRLSGAIGTTANRLKTDLKSATRGMVSDSELVAAAANFMSLGLVKTHDEAVRLTRVAGALGMNMNQLVLTLTNQTTMRFDALGVAVDGFDAKVDKLKSTGMSANEAFKEAFLQQAEEQLTKVGDVADSSAASFVKLDVALKTLGDTLKISVVPFLAHTAEGLTILLGANNELDTSLKRTNIDFVTMVHTATLVKLGLLSAEDAAKMLKEGMVEFNQSQQDTSTATREARYATRDWGMTAAEANKITRDRSKALTEVFNRYKPYIDATYDAAEAIEKEKDNRRGSILLLEAHQTRLNNFTSEYLKTTGQLKTAQDELAAAEKNWGVGQANEIASALEKRHLSLENQRKAYVLIDEVMQSNLTTQFDSKNAILDMVKAFDPNKPEEFKAALQGFKEAFMPLDEGVSNALQKVDELDKKLEALKKDITINIFFKYHGSADGGSAVPRSNVPAPRQHGGPVMGGAPYLVGERGPEIFVPTSGGQVVPNRQGMGGDVNIEFYISGAGDPNAVAAKAARRVSGLFRGGAMRYAGR